VAASNYFAEFFSTSAFTTDDHLRNHGFFVDEQGIQLSTAYDLNPSVGRNELSLAIDETDTVCDVSAAMNAYKSYGITTAQANEARKAIEAAVSGWQAEADRFGIPKTEQAPLAEAFEP
jgi:serine/threonine-protein kinase HipA